MRAPALPIKRKATARPPILLSSFLSELEIPDKLIYLKL
jgi:hypothetical protein